MKILSQSKLADQISRPWKNGGGETTQLAIYPLHGSFEKEDYYWRLSRARIQKSGPFSEFVGFNRGLVQLTGDTIKLGPSRLTRFEPFLFSGDKAIQCDLGNGEAMDLNILVNRAWGDFKITTHYIEKGKRLARFADFVCYYCHDGEMEVEGATYQAGELIVLEQETAIAAKTDLSLVVIELTARKGLLGLV